VVQQLGGVVSSRRLLAHHIQDSSACQQPLYTLDAAPHYVLPFQRCAHAGCRDSIAEAKS
jgi:hypothetical protein